MLNTLTLITVSELIDDAKRRKANQGQSSSASCPAGTYPIGVEGKPIRLQPTKQDEKKQLSEKGGPQLHQPVSADTWQPSKSQEKETPLAEPPPSRAKRLLGHALHYMRNSGSSDK